MQSAWILEIQSCSFSHSAKLVTQTPYTMKAYFIQIIKTKQAIKIQQKVSTQPLDFFFRIHSQTCLIGLQTNQPFSDSESRCHPNNHASALLHNTLEHLKGNSFP